MFLLKYNYVIHGSKRFKMELILTNIFVQKMEELSGKPAAAFIGFTSSELNPKLTNSYDKKLTEFAEKIKKELPWLLKT